MRFEAHEQIQYTPRELQNKLDNAVARLTELNQEYDVQAKKKSRAEVEYRKALQKKQFELRNPVEGKKVTATLAKDQAKGSEEVAELLYQRDLNEALWRAKLEATRNIREEIGVLRSLLTQLREEYKNM